MAITEQDLLAALAGVKDPVSSKPLATARSVRNLQVAGDSISFEVQMDYPAKSLVPDLQAQLSAAARSLAGVRSAAVHISSRITAQVAGRGARLIPGVKNIIAVASGKGGVGKSTTAVNLALALSAEGAQVGILDADIYGPSQPMMTGTSGKPETRDGKLMEPKRAMGLQINSIGFLVREEQAMAWRGPMASNALEQLINQTRWQDLDYLVVDMPPGTGDIQLTLAQKVPLTGAVIVTTPQDIALLDAKKGITMFQKVGVPILGIVENMAVHICSHCGHAEHIFGEDGGRRLAQDYEMPYLGALPLALHIRLQADSGRPTVFAEPDGEVARLYKAMARQLASNVARQAGNELPAFPDIIISKDT
ncbi:iron-sulfur cluster carrier protein ApbC [Comamonas flocculans]|uniref:Iron-sulfur cluster carrier protein n=1 Tax=Comamonas flocculans TaxID=2597701 RepID=A0A5B8RXJ0_9BURK|nr:iron-sulfur cluster carrier protein ApbC [Comamonas flocculans]QEA13444.1 iron-sulfur cluster carrier protein ApbC [Comamonas flocculans]